MKYSERPSLQSAIPSVLLFSPRVLRVYTRWHARKAEHIWKLDSVHTQFFWHKPWPVGAASEPAISFEIVLFLLPRMKCPLAGTNKRFLINTIKNTLPSHKEQDPEQKEGSKEATKSQGQKEEKRKKHRGHPYKHSFQARAPEGHSPHRKPSSRDKSGKRSNRR